jgi:crotonobetaine/carnitine-CoA ligase
MSRFTGLDDPGTWVLPQVLAEQAATQPEAEWFVGIGGERMSFGSAHADVRRVAGHLAALGVQRGDPVVLFAGNHADFVRAWLGLLSLGAVAVLLNTELRGAFLRHQLVNSGAALALADAALLPAIDEVAAEVPALARVVVIGAPAEVVPAAGAARPARIAWQAWRDAPPFEGAPPLARDTACIMYTSGTSGPSKGVLMPHAHCTLYGVGALECLQLRADDRYYIVLPLFHANGLLMQLAATLLAGIPAIVRPRFSASAWLDDIREHRATVTNCLGALAAFVVAQPPTPRDREHRLRAIMPAPNLPAAEVAFRERFGIAEVVSGYGMTEVNIPVWGRIGQSRPGAAGWVHDKHFEVIVADPETDRELPRGQVGEILVRPKLPFGFMAGYHGMPEKTVEAWRNLWFHTGDAGTMDESGLVTFVDRLKDCIRRRGENIAANEVEALLAQLPGVAELAAYAVPSELPGGEDELMLAIVPAPGTTPSLPDLGEAAERLLPRFARPRFLQLVSELPKTATGKVQRAVLRKLGSAAAHDRGDTPRRRG